VPQLAAGRALAAHAHAMMDVSDGLLLDAMRLAEASRCSAAIELDALPLSTAFTEEKGDTRRSRLWAASAGDDYALLAALPPEVDAATLSLPEGTTIARIGALVRGKPQLRLTSNGHPVELPETLGHEHRGTSAPTMADRP
jgi:thiamine-monophosphate kinase